MGTLQAAQPERRVFENDFLKLTVNPRTAQQMAAFYEGRGFPAEAILLTRTACFFTIGIHNKSRDILWLETANWRFQTASGPLKRVTREEWQQRWQRIGLALPHQSTFRWTLLPAELDFQADEHEGGNITLSRTDKPFSLHASFATGRDKQGPRIDVRIADLRCGEDQS
ncbi:hypothetical protein [Sulfuriflexus sp.]|uniref:hypothetical protein n=1 Tax=Sulfuriflexus sp. TaxID=2015443 RepID=UPI0028CF3EE2|nr:hypothetical protein [Sulfuriflexus sp.]MDT8404293.1 hypothetical protein [Sulfuriflexus sp.]